MSVTRSEPRRSAFTLIELLVVIAIIAVLMGLTLAGVQAVRARGMETQARNDLAQLTAAMQGFITDFGAPYPPPSVIDFDANGQNPYVQKVFPRAAPGVFPPGGHLDGDQVLVFFLGGPDGQGFSTNPANPMQTSGKRRPPNYEFPQSRLYFRAGNFRSYKDPYGNPYLYFGSGYGGNDYNGSGGGGYLVNGSPVTPYQENGTKFFNSHSFQIICGGKNGLYGPGGLLTPGTGNFAVGSPGGDDLTNFWPGMLSSSR